MGHVYCYMNSRIASLWLTARASRSAVKKEVDLDKLLEEQEKKEKAAWLKRQSLDEDQEEDEEEDEDE
jgi:hypothetical protein